MATIGRLKYNSVEEKIYYLFAEGISSAIDITEEFHRINKEIAEIEQLKIKQLVASFCSICGQKISTPILNWTSHICYSEISSTRK